MLPIFGVRLGAVSPDYFIDPRNEFVLLFEPQSHRQV
jgi:hypothetical protein